MSVTEAARGAGVDEVRVSPADHHRDVTGGWLRAGVFGAMDGLVSNTALISGVAGGGVSQPAVVLTGLAGLLAGAFSMATGEYTSVRSQNEATEAEVRVEAVELSRNPRGELAELTEMYRRRGLDAELARRVAEALSRDPAAALRVHAQEELGVDVDHLPSPWTAAFSSLLAFAVGAAVPLLPFLLGLGSALTVCFVLVALALFGAGAIVSRFTSRSALYSGGRQLLLGAVAAAVTFGIGALIGTQAT
jgi:VIT1/CCC1 family predicted Fe2+/Mn2+ transporter